MSMLYLRHYIPDESSGVHCPPCAETAQSIAAVVAEMAPRLRALDLTLQVETVQIRHITKNNCTMLNRVSFFAPEAGIPVERDIEEVLGAKMISEEGTGECRLSSGEPCGSRTLLLDGRSYAALPRELVTDALVRTVLSTFGGCDGSGCGTCTGCPR